SQKEKEYIKEKGMAVIEQHAYDFVEKRISSSYIENDGKQTPMKGHPVFKAMHACACCCRGCLEKWYRVPRNIELNEIQKKKIVNLLLAWIEKELRE
ncbi:MAG: DUF4186 domain-containing protein, partial [Solobacterium sp.]|nr:DUF4186 domain-containing protein [Solobacterium sp.]